MNDIINSFRIAAPLFMVVGASGMIAAKNKAQGIMWGLLIVISIIVFEVVKR